LQVAERFTRAFNLCHGIDVGWRQVVVAEQLRQRFTRLYAIGTPLLLNTGRLLSLGLRLKGRRPDPAAVRPERLWLNRRDLTRIVRRVTS
jgi:hypothetical protein